MLAPTSLSCFRAIFLAIRGALAEVLIVQQQSRHVPLNLAKIPPNQVIADFGRGSSVESESEWCPAGIIERFELFKMASKMATPY